MVIDNDEDRIHLLYVFRKHLKQPRLKTNGEFVQPFPMSSDLTDQHYAELRYALLLWTRKPQKYKIITAARYFGYGNPPEPVDTLYVENGRSYEIL